MGNGLSSRLVPNHERDEVDDDVFLALKKRQEGTMQLRHIRPGSLEWQDAQAAEVDQGVEKLTPEEIGDLRKMSEPQPDSRKSDKRKSHVQ